MNKEVFLIFSMLGISYGIRLSRVREIATGLTQVTPVPDCSEWVLGVINLRGEITPVIDFRHKFSTISPPYNNETIVIALKFGDDRTMAITVDAIETIETIDPAQTQEPPPIGNAIEPRYIEALVNIDGKMINLLNIDELMNLREI
ncbi:MAG: chemotaxis protein CheW [Helicobacteraceae bacterium]|jgi:purine-binding chemotaxis protein CheW|nr:chemotaxis protein CheW [Helicobacteraceae bacterium]